MKKGIKHYSINLVVSILLVIFLHLTISTVSAGIIVTPSSLTFDCNSVTTTDITLKSTSEPILISTSTTSVTEYQDLSYVPARKIISKDKIDTEISTNTTTEVMITLKTSALKTQAKSKAQRIQNAQFEMHNQLANFNAKTKHMMENIPVISAEIDAEAYEFLKTSPLVASVEAVLTVELHTSQGIPLMDADVYRPVFGGSGVAVAIVDSGIDYTHPALGNGSFPNDKVLGGYDFGNNDADPMPVGTISGVSHGTNCAGVACGDITAYADYIGGVAPEGKLYALKIMADNSTSGSTTAIASAIDWCVSHQYDDPNNPILVINMSVGGGEYASECDSLSSGITNAVNAATAAGITVLSSSGNDGYCDAMGLPACISNVISVGAVFDNNIGTVGFCLSDNSCIGTVSASCSSPNSKLLYTATSADQVTSYSNSSSLVDVLASSHNAYTTDIKGVSGSSVGDYYGSFGGTSAACAYASGAVASLQSAAKDSLGRFLTPDEVRQILSDNGQPITDTKNGITTPRISVANSIENLDIYSGQLVTIENDSRFSADISSITHPSWITLSQAAPLSIGGYGSTTLYVDASCETCNYEPLNDAITISGTSRNSSFSENIDATLNCPLCQYSANLNAGCEVDILDLSILANCWLSSDSACDAANIDGTFPVDQPDLSIMAGQWLEGK
ncbi:MAG: S8 family peptidase [Sedimentisphaeraceae bacterium JB056]